MEKQHYFLNKDTTLFVSELTGWVNTVNNSAFKSKFKQNELIDITNTPKSIIYNSNFYTDWTIEEEKTLPYQLEDILIQPNELVTAYVLNVTFEKLYTNLEYIASRSVFYSNTIPTNYIGWFGCALNMQDKHTYIKNNGIQTVVNDVTYYVDNKYQFHPNTKPCYQYYPCRYASLSHIKDNSTIYTSKIGVNINKENYSLIVNANDADEYDGIDAYEYSNSTESFYDDIVDVISVNTKNNKQIALMITSSAILLKQFESNSTGGYNIVDLYDSNSLISSANGYNFNNINSACLGNNGLLYISDNANNCIYQYDLNYIINDDNVIKQPILLNIIGGHDNTKSVHYKFNNIAFIRCSGNYVFVYDDTEYIGIIFDEYLNYKKTISNLGFTHNKPVGITYRDISDEYIILCENAKYYTFNSSFEYKYTVELNDITEKCVAIAASTIDSNVYYVATESSTLQKLFSNNKTVGYFNYNKLQIKNDTLPWWRSTYKPWVSCEDLWCGSYNFPPFIDTFNVHNLTVRNVNGVDEIWIYANNGRLIWLQNDISTKSLFNDSDDVMLYSKTNLTCSEQEYIQSLTYNKLSRKFIDMLQTFINGLKYVPEYEYNSSGEAIYKQLVEIDNKNFITETHLKNIKIYDNDILSVDVINRVLTHIFDIEQQILNATKPIMNAKYQITQDMEISIKE